MSFIFLFLIFKMYMKKLYYLLINLKIGLKHRNRFLRCYKTRLNKKFLNFLLKLSLVEGFINCPYYKYKYLIFLSMKNLNKKTLSNFYQTWTICFLSSIFNFESITTLNIHIKPSKFKRLKYKQIKKLKKKNNKSIYILSSNLGYLSLEEAWLLRIGGILLCKFDL